MLVKEYMHLNRKRRHLQKRIEKDKAEIANLEKRINEIKPMFEDKNDFINSGVVKGDEIVITTENVEQFRNILGNAVTDFVRSLKK